MPRGHMGGRQMSNEKAKDFKGTIKKLFAHLRPYYVKFIFIFIFSETKYGFNISQSISDKYSWKYKSTLFINAAVPVIYTLSIFSVEAFIAFLICPTILFNVGITSSR